MNSKTIIIVLGVVLVAAIALYLIFQNNTTPTDTSVNEGIVATSTATTTGNLPQTPNRVMLADNNTGETVTVSSVTLDTEGYIVIYSVDDTTSKTTIIGNSDLLDAGMYTNVRIDISRATINEEMIVAVLHEDDGDSTFEVPGADGYLTNPNGTMATDVDIVGVASANENAPLQDQIETYFEVNATTTVSTQ